MKKIIILSVVFFISFIVFCIMKLPAAIALDLAKPYLPKQLEIGQTVGSVWQGQMMQVRYQDEQALDLNTYGAQLYELLGQRNYPCGWYRVGR